MAEACRQEVAILQAEADHHDVPARTPQDQPENDPGRMGYLAIVNRSALEHNIAFDATAAELGRQGAAMMRRRNLPPI